MAPDFGHDVDAVPLQESLVGGARTTLYLLFGAVLVVLVVAVVNVTGLALVRAAGPRARGHGAGRRRREPRAARPPARRRGRGRRRAAAAPRRGGRVGAHARHRRRHAAGGAGAGARAPTRSGSTRARSPSPRSRRSSPASSRRSCRRRGAARADLRTALSSGARGASAGAGARRVLEGLVVRRWRSAWCSPPARGSSPPGLARAAGPVDPGFRAEQVTMAEVPPPGGPRRRARTAVLRRPARARACRARRALGGARQLVPFDGAGGGGVFDVEAHPRPPRGRVEAG
jgi:hypothetical protein